MQHKDLVASKQLEASAKDLVQYLNENHNDSEAITKIQPRRQRRTWTPDSQVCIRGDNRFHAEKKYRLQSKMKIRQALDNPDKDIVIPAIAYCQPWDWRW